MKSPFRVIRTALPLVFLLASTCFVARAQDDYASMKSWESFDYAAKTLTPADIKPLTIDDLKLVRGIVFGRHGRVFKDPDIRRYLESRDWFKANPDFSNSSLNETERANLDVIRIGEAEQHETVQ